MKQTDIRHKLAIRLQDLPADRVKSAILRWLGQNNGDLNDLEQELEHLQPKLSANQKALAFKKWSESHHRELPLLSEESISRESIYSNEQF